MQQSGDPLRIQVFNTLEDAILNGSYKEGDSLNELRLSKSLGVSRTPVREALMQLELEGLVKNIPNKGAVVVGISEQDVEDIYEIRIRTVYGTSGVLFKKARQCKRDGRVGR